MLILVGVSISILINSDLIGTAKNAGSRTESAFGEESNMGTIQVGDTYYDSIDDYIEGKQASHNWQYTDNTMATIRCKCLNCTSENAEGVTLSIGQSVANYTAGPEGTEWIVFGVESIDEDAAYENVLITTKTLVTTDTLELSGAAAYNTGISDIEAKVDELYGTEARGMTIEDVNRTLGYTPAGGMYALIDSSTGTQTYYTTRDFTTTINADANSEEETTLKTLWSSIQANAAADSEGNKLYYTPSNLEGTTDADVIGNLVIDGYMYMADSNVATMFEQQGITGVPVAPSETSNVVKNMIFGEQYELQYWLASCGVYAKSDAGGFGPGMIIYGSATKADAFFKFNGGTQIDYCAIRPVVSLGTNVLSIVGE